VKPCQKLGYRFQENLIERILKDLDDPSAELPLLEHALLRLWQQREGKTLTHKSYNEIGGITGSLEQHAEVTYLAFSQVEQEECKRICLRLTQPVDEIRIT